MLLRSSLFFFFKLRWVEIIRLSECYVLKWRYLEKWTTPKFNHTLPEVIGRPTSKWGTSYWTSRILIKIRWTLVGFDELGPALEYSSMSLIRSCNFLFRLFRPPLDELISRKQNLSVTIDSDHFHFQQVGKLPAGILGHLSTQDPLVLPKTLCLFVIRCASSWYAVAVRDTLCLFVIRCACSWYAVPVRNTLCLFPLRLTGLSLCLLLLQTEFWPWSRFIEIGVCIFPTKHARCVSSDKAADESESERTKRKMRYFSVSVSLPVETNWGFLWLFETVSYIFLFINGCAEYCTFKCKY